MEVEEFIRVDVFFPMPLGIGRRDNRWDLAGLHAWKGFISSFNNQLMNELGFGMDGNYNGWDRQAAEALRFQMNNRVLRWELSVFSYVPS